MKFISKPLWIIWLITSQFTLSNAETLKESSGPSKNQELEIRGNPNMKTPQDIVDPVGITLQQLNQILLDGFLKDLDFRNRTLEFFEPENHAKFESKQDPKVEISP